MTHFFYTTVGALLLLLTLPLALELLLVTLANFLPDFGLGCLSAKPRQGMPVEKADRPSLAILIPAHNEELLVGRSVSSLRESADAHTRIFVIAHNCVDGTAARATAAGAEVLVYDDPAAKGKGFALRYGFACALEADADAVLVVDADSTVSANTIDAVQGAFAGGARVVQCRYEMFSTTERANTRLSALAFRAFNVVRPRGRERLGLSSGILGNGFGIVRQVLEAIPYDAFSLVEDLEYHLHLVMAGERVRYLNDARIAADFPESQKGESVQRSRWEGGRMHTARSWALPLMGKILSGRLRLIEPLCDLTGMPLAFEVFALLLTACVPLIWTRWYAAIALGIILFHVLCAAWAGPDFLKTLQLLALSPIYILRKLWMIPGVLRGSSGKAAWVRTER